MGEFLLYAVAALIALAGWLLAKAFPRLAIIAGIVVLARCCYYLIVAFALAQAFGFFWGTLLLMVLLVPILLLASLGSLMIRTGMGVLDGTETNIEGKYSTPETVPVPPPLPRAPAPGATRSIRRPLQRASEGFGAAPWLIGEFVLAAGLAAHFFWPK